MSNTPVPFFDLGAYYRLHQNEINSAVTKSLESGWYVLGKEVEAFETALVENLKTTGYGVGVNSGTDALILSFLAAKVGNGDEVISASHTAIPGIVAILRAGATPVFCDVHPKTWLLDLECLTAKITPKTKAIVATHLYGNCVDIPSLRSKLATINRSDIIVIEDVAQAHGSRWNEKYAGSMGDFGAFSFYPSKNLGALGDGGLIFVSEEDAAKTLRALRNYGQTDRYHATFSDGINSRLDEVQAAILSCRLQFMDEAKKLKKHLVDRYRSAFQNLPFEFQSVDDCCEPAWHLFVIKLESRSVRDSLQTHLNNRQIGSLVHYPIPTHRQIAFEKFLKGPLPITEELCERILSLPMNPTLSEAQQESVIRGVTEFFRS